MVNCVGNFTLNYLAFRVSAILLGRFFSSSKGFPPIILDTGLKEVSGGTKAVTKILFIEEDIATFEIRKCIAAVLEGIQPLELFHAKDATEGLELLDEVRPDVIIIGQEERSETDLLLDGLTGNHPPVVIDQADNIEDKKRSGVTYINSDGSLEGIHQLLKTAQTLAALGSVRTDLAN